MRGFYKFHFFRRLHKELYWALTHATATGRPSRARVFVAPLPYGAGMKGKVGQSLIHGLPVVTMSVGAEGMALENEHHVLITADEEIFALQVSRLLHDDAPWRRPSLAGEAHIEPHPFNRHHRHPPNAKLERPDGRRSGHWSSALRNSFEAIPC